MAAPVLEVYKDKAGKGRWRPKGPDNEILADSGEGYKEKAGIENVILAVKKKTF